MKTKATISIFFKCIFFVFLLFIILGIYWPGLSGGFMLDDLSSLPTLFKTIESCGFECAVFSGSTGPTGRPISLLSFALQFNHWPDPYYFKMINIFIHLANFVLVVFVFFQLLKILEFKGNRFYIPLLAGLFWAVWPLQLSSVLYVVQRMVLISSFFVLFGVAFYLFMRPKLATVWKSQTTKWFILLVVLSLVGLAAIYSKESGVLLLVYILVLEFLIFKQNERSKIELFFRIGCLLIPFILLLLYLLSKVIFTSEQAYLIRDFTLGERILTQGRVLIDYLYSFYLPRPSNLGLYHDAYPLSTGLFSPFSTILSWAILFIAAFIAFALRQRNIFYALSVFWFLGGHVLESTVLPLEIYFEHRNYLPVMMIALATVILMDWIIRRASSALVRYVFLSIGVLYVGSMMYVCYSQASLWGKPNEYGLVQALEHPESIRARSLLVDVYSQLGMVDKAYEEVILMKHDFPTVAGVIVSDLEFACYDPKYPVEPLDSLLPKLRKAKFGYGVIVTISGTLSEISDEKCKAVDPSYILEIITVLKEHPQYAGKIHLLEGYEIAALRLMGRLEEAAEIYAQRFLLPEDWPRYISILATLGRLEEAMEVSERGLAELQSQPLSKVYFDDVVRLRAVLIDDIKNLNLSNQ